MKTTPKDDAQSLIQSHSQELLKELHILTRDGKINQDSHRKLKQVRHLVQLITPHLENLSSIADMGAGKSYLGFLLYDLWMKNKSNTQLWAIEQRPELINKCKDIATASKFDRIHFVEASIQDAHNDPKLPVEIDAVTALHACDTATDDAIVFALKKKARFIALVPCCQAEAARLLGELDNKESFEIKKLWQHNLHRREFGSHITNVLRSLILESRGYKVRVTELIGWEHSLKNEIILAERIQKSNPQAQKQLDAFLKNFPLPLKIFEKLATENL